MKQYRILALIFVALSLSAWRPSAPQPTERMIIMGQSADQVAGIVQNAQGTIERRLQIINGVVARVDRQQIAYLRSQGLKVTANHSLHGSATAESRGSSSGGIYPSTALGLDRSRPSGLSGRGVTVAIVDSGLPSISKLKPDDTLADGSLFTSDRDGHFLLYRDFTGRERRSQDPYGHGTHITGIIADAQPIDEDDDDDDRGRSRGIAPDVNLVVARAIGADGSGTYADAIAAIDWIVSIKDKYRVGVLNLSLAAPVQSLYWVDPLNQAVMGAWKSGLVVVVAAGNNGAAAETVAVPGNNPYVITVGAFRSESLSTSGEDEITTFSARGPTPDSGFVKPDVLAPGVRIVSALDKDSALAQAAADGQVLKHTTLELAGTKARVGLFQLSGTSMAAAEVSGLVALLLQQRPDLTNDQVKWLLSRTARLAVDKQTRQAAYSTWEQGFGKVNARALLGYSGKVESANLGMDVARDLDPSTRGQHYVGLTAYDAATGRYSIPASGDSKGTYFNWCGQFVSWPGSADIGSCGSASGGTTVPSGGTVWSGAGTVWSGGGTVWSGGGTVWSGGGTVWSGGGNVWSGAGTVWSGGGNVWSGHGSVWSGGGTVWSGGGTVWSGGGTVWSGINIPWTGNDTGSN